MAIDRQLVVTAIADAQADIVAKGILKIEDDLREAFPTQLELDFGD